MSISFQAAREELKALGLVLALEPGQYRVNFRKGTSTTAYFTDDLEDAVLHGRVMASQAPIALPPLGPLGGRYKRRAAMYRHNNRVAARRHKQPTDQKS